TADPHLWMLDNFPKKVWKFMSSNEISNYSASNYEKLTIIIIKKLKEHFSELRSSNEYTKYIKSDINEGTWSLDAIWMPLRISLREKINQSSKKRIRDQSNDSFSSNSKNGNDENNKQSHHQGHKSDATFLTRMKYKNDHKLMPFELFVCEVVGHPWLNDKQKYLDDTRKAYRMLKDMHDLISNYFFQKYGVIKWDDDLNIENLEVFAIIINGFNLSVYSMDKPTAQVYRIRLVESTTVPVQNEYASYYEVIGRLVNSVISIHSRMREYPGVFRNDSGIMFSKQQVSHQQTLQTTLRAADFKKIVIEDLIDAFVGGTIPQAPTLRQIYPNVFKRHFSSLKLLFDSKPVSIIMDESLDDCACSVVNTIFAYHNYTKLVSVDFLDEVNNSTIGQTLFYILAKYNIPFDKPIVFLSDSAAYMKKSFHE
ncbi:12944_t:CDS:2, partial [Entrophospora sp. SA101]